jgi:hypothetical protein
LDGLKVGNEALKKANAMFSIEEIEQVTFPDFQKIAFCSNLIVGLLITLIIQACSVSIVEKAVFDKKYYQILRILS